MAGLPHIPPVPVVYPNNFTGPHGFPLWVRYCNFFNFLFVTMLIRSGLSILADHPRLYFNDDCTPGSEWICFTPIKVPRDRLWTAKDDARYLTPLVGTPDYTLVLGSRYARERSVELFPANAERPKRKVSAMLIANTNTPLNSSIPEIGSVLHAKGSSPS